MPLKRKRAQAEGCTCTTKKKAGHICANRSEQRELEGVRLENQMEQEGLCGAVAHVVPVASLLQPQLQATGQR